MLPKLSLLDEIRKGGFEASLVATFNAYLPFYEDVVLRRLVNAGVRHNVLMMDHGQYTSSLLSHPPRLAGRHYTLAPISVPGAFHPKLIFLAGKSKGLVAIGSHNLTLAGFGYNRELTNIIRIRVGEDGAGRAIAAQVWREVEHWLAIGSAALPKHVVRMVDRVREFASWLQEPVTGSDSNVLVLGGRPGGESLWSQLRSHVRGRTKDVIISGPFYDTQLKFVTQLARELEPERIFLAVEPGTVVLPSRVRQLSNVYVVRADGLGVERQQDQQESGGYLHAKGLLVRLADGEPVFASGSANPSAPAWLATPGAGNIELMLARVGDTALEAATELGFTDVPGMPGLTDEDWEGIGRNVAADDGDQAPAFRTGVALAEAGQISVDADAAAALPTNQLRLLSYEREELSRGAGLLRRGAKLVVELPPEETARIAFLQFAAADSVSGEFLVHHVHAIEENARSGVQRRFREALDSLDTDLPDIELLIDCIDKIVFSDAGAQARPALKLKPGSPDPNGGAEEATATLSIDVAETKKTKSKQRLLHTSDFAYLLDALIYHLRFQGDKALEELDAFGRSEEEQVGADDAEDVDSEQSAERRQVQLLEICHAKVKKLINRMVDKLGAYRERKQTLDKIIVRLLAVLAVLRQLRGCDARAPWVKKGETTVPPSERARLFREVMMTLFEGKPSLLHPEALGDALVESDEMARLKGMLLWLAWDCGVRMRIEKPFMESAEDLHQRLLENAMLLSLVQAVQGDNVVEDEARQSIAGLAAGELDWLGQILTFSKHLEEVKNHVSSFGAVGEPCPGDVAVHKELIGWDLRVVASRDGGHIRLVRLDPKMMTIAFLSDRLVVLPIAALWQP